MRAWQQAVHRPGIYDLALDTGQTSGRIAPGETETFEVGVVGRSIDGWCTVVGHRQMGMVLGMIVGVVAMPLMTHGAGLIALLLFSLLVQVPMIFLGLRMAAALPDFFNGCAWGQASSSRFTNNFSADRKSVV